MLGLTATPFRMDRKDVTDVCGDIVHSSNIKEAINNKILVPIEYNVVKDDIDFSGIKWNGKTYDRKSLNRRLCITAYDEAIYKEYVKSIVKKKLNKTICFCATIEHTLRMEDVFIKKGIKARALTSKIKFKDRENVMEEFRNGDIEILFVRDLFNEGVDVPDIDSVIMLRPTESHTIFAQQIGRGLRKSPNKKNIKILDFTGNSKNCVVNFEVLSKFLEHNILDYIQRDSNRNKQELVIIIGNSKITLTKEKIDILNEQMLQIPTKQELIDEYHRIHKKVGKMNTPIFREHTRYKYSRYFFNNLFGSWRNFKNSCRFDKMSKIDIMVKQYIDYEKKVGRKPKMMDFVGKKFEFTRGTIVRDFGSWKEFIKYVNKSQKRNISLPKTTTIYTKKQLNEEFKKMYKVLGRRPYKKDFDVQIHTKVKYLNIKDTYGSWAKFLNANGVHIKAYKKRSKK